MGFTSKMGEEEFIEDLKKSSILGVAIYTEEGKLIFVNKKAADILEYTPQELIGKKILDIIIDGVPKEKAKETLKRRLSGKQFLMEYEEIYLKSKYGSPVPCRVFSHTVYFNDKPAGFLILYDRTKEKSLKQIFTALSEINELIIKSKSEKELLQGVCNVLVDKVGYFGASIGTISKKTKLYNVKFIRIRIKELEKSLKDKIKIGVDPSQPWGKGSVSKAYHTKKIVIVENVIKSNIVSFWKDEYIKFKVFSTCSIPILSKGKVKYIILIANRFKKSFTEEYYELLKKIQDNISFSLEYLSNIQRLEILDKALELSHEWALITNNKGKMLHTNKAVSSISGYEKDELLGKKPNIFKSGFHDESFYKNLWENILKGKVIETTFINKSKEGNIFYLDSIIIPIKRNGKITNFVDLSRDITDIIKYENSIKFQSMLYNILFKITNLSIISSNEEEFLQGILEILTQTQEIDAVHIITKKNNRYTIDYYSTKKDPTMDKFIRTLKNFIEYRSKQEKIQKLLPAEKSLKYKRIYLSNDLKKSASKTQYYPFNMIMKLYNMSSCCSIPIVKDSQAIGTLVIFSRKKGIFNKEIYNLLQTIQKHIKYILEKIEENKLLKIIEVALNKGFEFIIVMDSNFKIVYASDNAIEYSGYSKEELIGKHHSIFSSKTHTKEFSRHFYKTLKSGNTYSGIMKYKIKDGRLIDFYTTIIPFIDNKNQITHYISIGKQLDEQSKLRNELDKILHYDTTTGLYNMYSFKESVCKFIERAKLQKSIGAVAIVNPISFKSINQAFGFNTGNEILKLIGKRLKENLRTYDIVARLESERFGILLKDIRQEQDIISIISKIMNVLKIPYLINNKTISLSFNIGISIFPKDAISFESLVDRAQIALADARRKGENQIGFFRKELETLAKSKFNLKMELENAIKSEDIEPFFQPYVDKNKKIVGCEVLIRWIRDGDAIPPAKFIPILEETHLIVEAEKLIFKKAIEYINQLSIKNVNRSISFNISEKTLHDNSFIEMIAKETSQIEREIRIEVLERTIIKKFEAMKTLMLNLKKQGIKFSLDDFGTGYSSLSYLSELPVDYLKIDISFIKKLLTDKHTRDITESIIFISKKLGIKTIAEGVETEEQFEMLKNMGCDYFQGYLFFRPLSFDKLKNIL